MHAPAVDTRILREEPERARDHHASIVGAARPRQGAQQRGLARAVAPDQADFVARVHVEALVVDKVTVGDGYREVQRADHRATLPTQPASK